MCHPRQHWERSNLPHVSPNMDDKSGRSTLSKSAYLTWPGELSATTGRGDIGLAARCARRSSLTTRQHVNSANHVSMTRPPVCGKGNNMYRHLHGVQYRVGYLWTRHFQRRGPQPRRFLNKAHPQSNKVNPLSRNTRPALLGWRGGPPHNGEPGGWAATLVTGSCAFAKDASPTGARRRWEWAAHG